MAWFALARVVFAAIRRLLRRRSSVRCRRARGQRRLRARARRAGRRLRGPAPRYRRHAHARRAARRRDRPSRRARDRGRLVLGRPRPTAGSCFSTAVILIVLPYLGLVLGAQARRVARAGAPRRPVFGRRPRAALQDSRHQRHHRRPHRRRLRDRLRRRHPRHPAVRAEGAAAGRRLVRFAEAQPRPPRPRHPAADPEDVRHRGHHLRRRLSRASAKSI